MNMEWIKIEDKKPPNSHYVLVALYDPRPKVNMYFILIAERMNNDWYEGGHGECITTKGCRVTHWMPLPDEPVKNKE